RQPLALEPLDGRAQHRQDATGTGRQRWLSLCAAAAGSVTDGATRASDLRRYGVSGFTLSETTDRSAWAAVVGQHHQRHPPMRRSFGRSRYGRCATPTRTGILLSSFMGGNDDDGLFDFKAIGTSKS